MSTNPTPGCAVMALAAPYPRCWRSPSSAVSWSMGLWQCQNSIISAQFSLGKSFHVVTVALLTKICPHARQEIGEPGLITDAGHGSGWFSGRNCLSGTRAGFRGNLQVTSVDPLCESGSVPFTGAVAGRTTSPEVPLWLMRNLRPSSKISAVVVWSAGVGKDALMVT